MTQDFCSRNVNELKSLSHTPVFPFLIKLSLQNYSAETAIITVLMAFTGSSRAAHLSHKEDLGIFNVLAGCLTYTGSCVR